MDAALPHGRADQPRTALAWLGEAARLIRRLGPRYWLLVIIAYSGKAMLPFVPAGTFGSGMTDALSLTFALLILWWMPYIFLRAMDLKTRPAALSVHLLTFALVALAIGAIETILRTGMHSWLVTLDMRVASLAARAGMMVAGVTAALVTVRLLPLYAGSATARLAALDRGWWTGMTGVWPAFAGAIFLCHVTFKGLALLVPLTFTGFTGWAVLYAHVRAYLDAGEFLFGCGLALAACHHVLRLRETAA